MVLSPYISFLQHLPSYNSASKSNPVEALLTLSHLADTWMLVEAVSAPFRSYPSECFSFGLPALFDQPSTSFSLERDIAISADDHHYHVKVTLVPANTNEALIHTAKRGQPRDIAPSPSSALIATALSFPTSTTATSR